MKTCPFSVLARLLFAIPKNGHYLTQIIFVDQLKFKEGEITNIAYT